MTAVNYCFTLNNHTEEELKFVREITTNFEKVRYVFFEEEKGESGTPHLQGALGWWQPQRMAACKKLIKRGHFEQMRGNVTDSLVYCNKEGKMEIYGDVPKEKGQGERDRWAAAIQAAKEQRLSDIPADMYTRYYRFYEKLANENMPTPVAISDIKDRFYWIWGPTGSGKSTLAEEMALKVGKPYKKMVNKWWDSYNGTDPVIIEEWSPDFPQMGYFLKQWADHRSFRGENKGGSKEMRPSHIFITSNFSIDECFPGRDGEALKRRFNVIYKD